MFEILSDFRDPAVVLDSTIAVDECDKDISQETRDIEGDQSQNQIMLLLGDEQLLALVAMSGVSADFPGALVFLASLQVCVGLTLEEGLFFVLLIHGVGT